MSRLTDSQIKAIYAIAFWMMFATIPGLMDTGLEKSVVPLAALELSLYLGMVITASGLFFRKEWARRWAIRVLCIHFGWALYVVCILFGSSFSATAQWVSQMYDFSEDSVRIVLLALLLIYILWPVIVIYFLSFPRIKRLFDPNYDPVQEEQAP